MTEQLPDPLIPADVDLRDFAFTPIFRARLFGSAFHARTTDSEWRAGVTLWLKSWDQVPAGTLPDDDIDLCRLAELGRDMKAWKKVRVGALHGWAKCSDGRLHHQVVAEGVLEAWERRSRASTKGKAGASKRWGNGNPPAMKNHSPGIAQAMPGDSKGQGQGQGQSPLPPKANGHAKPDEPQEVVEAFFAIREIVFGTPAPHGISPLERSIAAGWLEDGATFYPVRDLFEKRMKALHGKGKPSPGGLKYLDSAVREAMAQNFPGYSP